MTQLLFRTALLIVDTLQLSGGFNVKDGLDFSFTAKKSLKPEPNTLDLKVRNLTDAHRQQIEQKATVPVRLEVGYGGDNQQIFLGEVRSGGTTVQGPSRITNIASGDSEKEIQKSRCKVNFGAQVSVDTALRAIIDTMGIGEGNLQQAVARLQARGITNLFPRGGVFYGNTWQQLQGFARSANLEISIQDGALQILDKGKALAGNAILLSSGFPNTGLIESPSVDADGTVSAKTLMNPEIRPGVLVTLQSLSVNGTFRVWECEYKGDTRGNEWTIDLTLQKPKA